MQSNVLGARFVCIIRLCAVGGTFSNSFNVLSFSKDLAMPVPFHLILIMFLFCGEQL